MLKKSLQFVLLFFPYITFSQVGINTDSPEATLDIRATNHNGAVTATDGLLVPRVNDLTTNGSVNGQMVYLITDNGSFSPGFYYWNNTQWSNVASSARTVTNELYFEDDDFNYVSLLINTTGWEVYRYSKADINVEMVASGTGAQPNVLADVQGLTYN